MDVNLDLPRHAADKVRKALNDVAQLTDDHGERLRIYLMASSSCIGAAIGTMHALSVVEGANVSKDDITDEILKIIEIAIKRGADATMQYLNDPDQSLPQENDGRDV